MSSFKVERTERRGDQVNQNPRNEFADYMWMEDVESFDNTVYSQIAEDDYIRSSIEMLLEEEERDTVYFDENKEKGKQAVQGTEQPIYEPNEAYLQYNGYFGDMGLNPSALGFENLALQQPNFQYQQPAPSYSDSNNTFVSYQHPVDGRHYQQHPPSLSQQHSDKVSSDDTSNVVMKSNLNPNAAPFTLNAEAAEFVPRSFIRS